MENERHDKRGAFTGLVRQARAGAALAAFIVAGAFLADTLFTGISDAADQPSSSTSAVPVELAKVTIEDFPVYLSGLGTVQPFNTVAVKTRIDGQLQKVFFTEGQTVKEGDLLALIDPRPFQAAVDQAAAKIQQDEADIENAQYLLAKDQKLIKQGVSTDETVETQQSQVNQLLAQLAQDKAAKEAADVSLSYTEIRSPITGRTGIRLIDAGNQVHASDATGIVTVTQTQPISVVSTLREQDLPGVLTAMSQGAVQVSALPSDSSTVLDNGVLSLIDNQIDADNGTVRLKSTFPNVNGTLWPGQFVILRVLQNTLKNATTIPSSALQRGPDGFYVYVVGADNKAEERKVQPGPINGGRAVVVSGLAGTERVISDGQYRVKNGSLVSAAVTTQLSNNVGKGN